MATAAQDVDKFITRALGNTKQRGAIADSDHSAIAAILKSAQPVSNDVPLAGLNARLLRSAFLTSATTLHAEDLIVYASVAPALSGTDEKTRATLPCVIRWVDYIQHLVGAAAVHFQLPPTTAAFDPAAASAAVAVAAAASSGAAGAADQKSASAAPGAPAATPKKDKKNGGDSGSGSSSGSGSGSAAPVASAAPATAASGSSGGDDTASVSAKRKEARAKDKADATKDEKKKERPLSKKELAALQLPIAKLELKVGRIVSAKPHPNDAKLYVEEVDIGAGAGSYRTVVSTFADYFPLSKFAAGDVLCVVATNLEVADIKSVKSTGRIFDVQKDGKKEWLTVPAGAKIGECITFAGAGSTGPDKEIAAKKFRELLKEFATNNDKVATWRDIPLMTSAGPCFAPSFAGGKIG